MKYNFVSIVIFLFGMNLQAALPPAQDPFDDLGDFSLSDVEGDTGPQKSQRAKKRYILDDQEDDQIDPDADPGIGQ